MLCGLVINWGAVDQINLHVDPLVVQAKVVLDGTGHGSGIGQMIVKKGGSLKIKGEKFMWAARGEEQVPPSRMLPHARAYTHTHTQRERERQPPKGLPSIRCDVLC